METLAISALVGSIVSFLLERIPGLKAWLGRIPLWGDYLFLAALFFGVPGLLAVAACSGYTFALAPATCPGDKDAVLSLVINCATAFVSSQAWHGMVNYRLESGPNGKG